MIELADVTAVREGRTVLAEVSVSLPQRSIAVIGANGSGKSTFARLLNGLVAASAGTVRVDGLDPAVDGRALRARVGMIFSNPVAQLIMPTVREDLGFTLRGRRLKKPEIEARSARALERVGMLDHLEHSVYQLSGGQQQLVALASVLVAEPSVILADEPTALLDLGNARQIERILLEESGAQVVLVTHDLELASRCEHALCFRGGRLADQGAPADVIERYRRSYA
ncbi:energy-coupling factor ABC transporter ATP-binding protein [Gulosibacter sp. 10]|uniref:energy-coupling factor ABC transporter ATP-binding protein n=1 Tax=Gulosibacter sp. 10 TaxID=1255570 RepID=UPI00097F1224|nr:ABC transporter ATP-binding protein [Gulosibacter sp. 10]SJM53169.1 ATPase component BioM of energizing module of biotin ECF transporter [Gulosibacter sp. 10]